MIESGAENIRKAAAKSLAAMIDDWVREGIKLGTDWRSGLPNIIEKRLERFSIPSLPPDAGEALRLAREALELGIRLVDYFANNRTSFAGGGTPMIFIRDAKGALAALDKLGDQP